MKQVLVIMALCVSVFVNAQTVITGVVKEEATKQPIAGATIKVAGKLIGTTADFDGNFTLKTKEKTPFYIEVTSIGFASQKIQVRKNNQKITVLLKESATSLNEVVISASRTPERVLESPVTIERMDIKAIKNTSSPDFYSGLENLKGVDINTNSLTFKSVNTRGFATFSNTRFMQLNDGMDNSSPALNFPLGNLLGMSELDVNTVEILPGASSALYGANAFNGILFMTSKNPFDFSGQSAYVKSGVTSQKAAGTNVFVDASVRVARKFSEKFAAKASFSFFKGTEWYATDYKDYENKGATPQSPNYNGLNKYGDEVAINMDAQFGTPAGTMGTVARTGYNDIDVIDPTARSFKGDVALHYRPNGDDLEFIYNAKIGSGKTVYQGASRFSIDNFIMQQHKLEVKNNRFFVRGYMIAEDAGDSYNSLFAAINMNNKAKSNANWFTDYYLAFSGALHNPAFGGIFSEVAPAKGNAQAARAFADNNLLNNAKLNPYQLGALNTAVAPLLGLSSWNRTDNARYVPGTDAYKKAFNEVISNADFTTGGAQFKDNTKMYHFDANYQLKEIVPFADVQIGGSWRMYSLNSHGTIFTDYKKPIDYTEYGIYTQIQKKMIDDRLKVTGSVRYDKSKNFDGSFSPRLSVSYSLGEDKTRNLRASFQTGFRNPTTQDQYIGLNIGNAILVGAAKDNLTRYKTGDLSVSAAAQGFGFPATIQLLGKSAYENSFTLASVLAGTPKKADVENLKPEKVTAYELGYRAELGVFDLDVSAYYNKYEDFIGGKTVVSPYYGKVDFSDTVTLPSVGATPLALVALSQGDYQPFYVYTNSSADISSYGGTLGVNTKINGYRVGMNYTYAEFKFDQSTDPGYEAGFNTPKHKVKVSFGHPNVAKNIGFNINYRWSDSFYWESSFVDAQVDARSVIDAQVTFTMPSWYSQLKIGGANIGGKEYFSAPGAGKIGSQYYASWTIDL